MVSVSSYCARGEDQNQALRALDASLGVAGTGTRLVFAFHSDRLDAQAIHDYLRQRFPAAELVGGTSHGGVINERGTWNDAAVGVLLIDDEHGDFGVAAGPLGDDPAASAQALLQRALLRANCPGQIPELIWVYQAPGQEERVLDGLRRIVGERCPVVGGSAADDDIRGRWRQFGPDGVFENGLAVAVLFPSGGIGCAFQGGYEPAGPSAIATAVQGRALLSLDGRPAAAVYDEWLSGRLRDRLAGGGTIIRDTTLSPLGVEAGHIGPIPHYLLVHPHAITPGGGMSLFATLDAGTRIHAMRGSRDRLVERAGRVISRARAQLNHAAGHDALAGGLVVYCAGCRMAVDEHIGEVTREAARSFGNAPFLGCFTFGEQGCLLDHNVHGNLMISAIVFGR